MSEHAAIAIVGATGLKTEAFLKKLSAAGLVVKELFLLDDDSVAGEHIEFGKQELLVNVAAEFDFTQVQHVILLGEASLSEQLYPAIESAGCSVIDASGFLGARDDISLANLLTSDEVSHTVAIPEATTLQLMFALQPILQETSIEFLSAVALQCAAQGGKAAVEELGRQSAQLLNFQEIKPAFFQQQLAFNVIPQVGELEEAGATSSEQMLRTQMGRLFILSSALISVQQLWVPVFFGDVVMTSLKLADSVNGEQLISQWQEDPLVNFSDGQIHTPVSTASGKGLINISRLQTWSLPDGSSHVSFCAMTDPVQLSALVTLSVLKRQIMV